MGRLHHVVSPEHFDQGDGGMDGKIVSTPHDALISTLFSPEQPATASVGPSFLSARMESIVEERVPRPQTLAREKEAGNWASDGSWMGYWC
jgi:hypothetical protein